MEDQFWPDVDDEEPDQYWPEEPPPALSEWASSFVDHVKMAFETYRGGMRPYLVVSRKLGKELAAAGFDSPSILVDDAYAYLRPTKELREAAEGKKLLKNGREMPIVLRNTGPSKDQFRRRGKG